MKKINVLPQTFYQFKCDESLVNEVLTLAKEEQYIIQRYGDPASNSKSVNNLLHKEERYSKLIDWINKCINEVKEDLKFQCEKFTITQCWLNSAEYGQNHHKHLHPNSFLSGIFYVNDSDSNTLFYGDNSWNHTGSSLQTMNATFGIDASNFSVHRKDIIKVTPMENPDLEIIHEESSVKGKLIVFPSNILHSVLSSCSFSNTRYTLSFNTFPSGKIGNMSFLAGLELEIK